MFMKQQIKDLIQRVDALEHELGLLCGRVKKIEEKIFPLWKINDEVNDNLVPLQSAMQFLLNALAVFPFLLTELLNHKL